MQVGRGQPDYSEKISFLVDESAESCDLDDVVADFLIALFEQPRPTSGDGTG